MTYPNSYMSDATKPLPDPVGIAPMGVLIAVA